MKMMLFLLLVIPVALSASYEEAFENERLLLCKLVDRHLEENSIDMALDLEQCQKKSSIQSKIFHDGFRIIKGDLPFNTPLRPEFELNCSILYYAQPLPENIIGEISCQ